MKKVLVLEGSPRTGNTSTVTDWVLAGMGKGVKAERVRVCDLNINGCRECFGCSKSKKAAGCAQEDDMVELYDKMIDADLVIWTSPIFCWGVTAQTKTVLDRCFALLTGEDLIKGSNWALVLTAGGDHYDGADLAVQMFTRLARYAGVKFLGQHVAANCPDGRLLKANRQFRAQAQEFGKTLRRTMSSSV
jgi:multimeric flavodoxin WrbA